MKTPAIVLRSTNETPCVEMVEIPNLKPGQVLVKIVYSGICHTQLSEIRGKRGEDRYLPHLLGHEGSGFVEMVGESVKKVKKGDAVVVSWIKGSGAEVSSTQYGGVGGIINAGAVTTFMEYAVVSENRVTPIPKDMPLKEAALLGCALPTGAGSVRNHMNIDESTTFAVFGVGGIGSSAIMEAKYRKADMIIAVDVVPEKMEYAKELGATHVINAAETDVLTAINQLTTGLGVDYAFESVGRVETMETAFSVVRNNGGVAVLAGNPPFGAQIKLNPYDLIKGKKIIGTAGGASKPDQDIAEYVDRFLAGEFPLDRLIGPEFKLEEFEKALLHLEAGKNGRAILRM